MWPAALGAQFMCARVAVRLLSYPVFELKRMYVYIYTYIIVSSITWSDPTENDSVEGLRPNARGPGLVTFGPDCVKQFCENNG